MEEAGYAPHLFFATNLERSQRDMFETLDEEGVRELVRDVAEGSKVRGCGRS